MGCETKKTKLGGKNGIALGGETKETKVKEVHERLNCAER